MGSTKCIYLKPIHVSIIYRLLFRSLSFIVALKVGPSFGHYSYENTTYICGKCNRTIAILLVKLNKNNNSNNVKKNKCNKSYVETAELWRNTHFKWFFSLLIQFLELYPEFAKSLYRNQNKSSCERGVFYTLCIYILNNVYLNGEAHLLSF